MRKAKHILVLATIAAVPMAATSSFGAAYTWTGGTGTVPWSTGWTPASGPIAPADTATIPSLNGNLLINVDVTNAILGALTFGSTGFNTDIGNANNTGNGIVLDNTGGTGNVVVTSVGTGVNTISAPLTLSFATTEIAAASTQNLTISGPITASGAARTLNNLATGTTLTLSGTINVAESGATTARGLNINATGANASGNVIISGNLTSNGASAANTPVFLGSTNQNSATQVRPTITISGDNSAFAGNFTVTRVNVNVNSATAFGTGRLLLNGGSSSIGAFLSSNDDSRTITNTQVQIQQLPVINGEHSLAFSGNVYQSASRGIANFLPAGKTLTLNKVFTANTANDARIFIFDGSGTTVVNNGVANGFDTSTNAEFATLTGGFGSIDKRGTGTTIINGTSTFSNGVRVRGGLLEFGTTAALGNSAGTTTGFVVDPGGAVGLTTGSLNPVFLNRFTQTAAGSPSNLSTDFTSGGAIALADADANTAINYGAGGNFSATNLQGVGIGAVSAGATYNGAITPANSTYRLGGGGTLTLGNPSNNQLTGANSVLAKNGGSVVINGTNNYTGSTTIGGVYINPLQELQKLGQQFNLLNTPVSLRANSMVTVSTLANGGSDSALGASSNAASNLVLDGGTLRYVGNGSSTDRLLTIGANGATLDASGSGAVNFTNTNAIVTADAGTRSAIFDTARVLYVNSDTISDLTPGMTVSGTGIAEGTTISAIVTPNSSVNTNNGQNGRFQIILSANATGTAATPINDLTFGNQNRALNLTGSSTAANTLSGSLANSAAGTLALNKTGTGTWNLAGTNTYTGATTVTGGTLTVANPAAVSAASAVTVGGGSSAAVYKIGWNGVTTSASLAVPTFAANGKLDIAQGRVVLTGTTEAAIAALVGDGASGNGTIFTSSFGGGKAVGYTDAGGSGITVRYTYQGDADLNGIVDFNDFLVLQNNFNSPGFYDQGDFNYNGTVDFNDFLVLQNNFNKNIGVGAVPPMTAAQVAAITSFAATVPEPTSLALLGLGAAAALRRRKAC